MSHYVYVLTNARMPGLVKIGNTNSPKERFRALFHTGCPQPFDVEVLVEVEGGQDRAVKLEKALHELLAGVRVHAKREFFEMDPERLRPLLELHGAPRPWPLDGEGMMEEDADDQTARKQAKKKRPPLNFKAFGIEAGEVLVPHRVTGAAAARRAEVVGEKKVKLDGSDSEMSLTRATQEVHGFPTARGPCPYWTHQRAVAERDVQRRLRCGSAA